VVCKVKEAINNRKRNEKLLVPNILMWIMCVTSNFSAFVVGSER
jgi:hypothetical protein